MATTAVLTRSSIKMFVRNRQALFFTLFTPLIIMVVFGVIGFNRPASFDVGFVIHRPSPATQHFIEQLEAFPTFKAHTGDLNSELNELNHGNRIAVLAIPDDFIPMGSPPATPKTLTAYLNQGQPAESQTVISVITQFLDKTTLTFVRAPTLFMIQQQQVNANNLTYIDFLLPGLVALSIIQMSVFSVAFAFAQYKEKGVLKRLLATPMRPRQFVTANVLTRLLVALLQTIIFILVGILAFKVHIIGSYLLILLCVILGALMFLGLGFTISGISKTVETVPALANLIVFPMLFLGGTFFPVSSFPHWLQVIARYLPLTYFSTALRNVMTQDAGINDIKWDLLAMFIWAVVLIFLAVYTFSFQEKEPG